ncbi:malonyl-ACP O-methyltransferase BioC [Kroppenstedtia pulmonis]|uniref:malonyl-ACP O-methyltransferase BioC n=1 Tax=Kroppenstedtia pulmonis TaxID=1380685 RepID=UPI00248362AF|nr:malonyl-ACP O-methyltransferase BioC [Kroppenstedtia pulmonis]
MLPERHGQERAVQRFEGVQRLVEMEKKKIAQEFNRQARAYDQYAVVQKRMAHRLMETAVKQIHPKNILEIGCGTGYLTQLLLEQYPDSRLTVIDLAENMMDCTRKRTRHLSQVQYWVGDAEKINWKSQSYDLIIANAAVHWFSDPGITLNKLAGSLCSGGVFVCSTFGPDTFQELNTTYTWIEREYHLSSSDPPFYLRNSHKWKEILQLGGLSDVKTQVCWHRIEYKDCCEFLHAVRRMGGCCSRYVRLPQEQEPLSAMKHRYNQSYRMKQGGVYATYQIIQLCGRKR